MSVDTGFFPYQPLGIRAQLYLNGAWTDITNYLRETSAGERATIERGQQDESSGTKPSTCSITLNNLDGRFSPRNPAGPYYGYLTRNTPFRLDVLTSERRFAFGDGSSQLVTPDGTQVSITGDLDVRYEADLRSWCFSGYLLTKGTDTGSQQSYSLLTGTDGTLTFKWSSTGSNTLSATSTSPLPLPLSGRKAVRVTIDVDNGAAGRTVTFYYSSDGTLSGSWTQLGSAVVQAGTTSIFDSTSTLGIFAPAGGSVYAMQLRNGIAGSVVANPTASAVAEAATSFSDAAGRTWSTSGNLDITAYRRRFNGEVSDWPVTWEPGSAAIVDVPITASGVLRRLGQGAQGLGSTYRRGITRLTVTPAAYWPLEDESNATSFASPIGGNPGIWSGAPQLAAFDGFPGSAPLPTMGNGVITLQPTTVSSPTALQVRWMMYVPAAGATDAQVILQFTAGDLLWQVIYGTGGTLQLRAAASAGGTVSYPADTGAVGFAVNGDLLYCSVDLTQFGSDITANLSTIEVGQVSGGTFGTSATNRTLGGVRTIALNPQGTLTDVAIGHVTVQNLVTSLFDTYWQLAGYAGETAGGRIYRLCAEEGIPYYGFGKTRDSVLMGVQQDGTLLELIDECVAADGGLLMEVRDASMPALGYKPLSALLRQSAQVAASMTSPSGLTDLQPTDDDQQLRNDLTVTRRGASSYRAIKSTGNLSVAAVGRYDDSVTLNLQTDFQLAAAAGWRLHKGTYDEARWPRMCFDLHQAGMVSSATLANLLALDIGQRVTVDNLPSFLPPGPAATIVTALKETIGPFVWDLELTGIPAGPYDTGRVTASASPGTGQLGGKVQAVGSTTSGSFIAGTNTSLTVVTTGRPWVTTANQFPFDILVAGARLRVTAISSATSPQTFTISTTVVNGATKTIPSGSVVLLADPVRAAP